MTGRATSSLGPTARRAAVLGVVGLLSASCSGGSESGSGGGSGDGSASELAVGTAVVAGPVPDVASAPGVRIESLTLPDGGMQVSWTADAGTVSQLEGLDGDGLSAAIGGELLLVEWSGTPSAAGLTSSRGQSAAQGEAEDELALLSAGERTVLDVDRLDRSRGRVAAAVADPDDVTLEVTFDGVTQSFGPGPDDESVPAVAQVLYDGQPVSEYTSCAAERSSAGSPTCRAEALWLPWVAGQGWAPEGLLWPVVTIRAVGDRAAPPSAIEVSSATLEGRQPLADVSADQSPGELLGTLVFGATAAGTVDLAVELTASYAGSEPATSSGEVTLTQGS